MLDLLSGQSSQPNLGATDSSDPFNSGLGTDASTEQMVQLLQKLNQSQTGTAPTAQVVPPGGSGESLDLGQVAPPVGSGESQAPGQVPGNDRKRPLEEGSAVGEPEAKKPVRMSK